MIKIKIRRILQNSEQYTAQNPDPSFDLAEAFDASASAAPFALGRQYAFRFKGAAAEYFASGSSIFY